jgi:hypothetical protein
LEFDICYALFSVIATFSSPFTWDHYNLMLLFPLGVVAREVVRCSRDRAMGVAAAWGTTGAAAVALLGLDRLEKMRLRELLVHGHGEVHFRMHLWDAFNWLPMVLLIAALGTLLAVHRRSQGSGA